jgi:leukotriene-A4 hydrolase
MQFRDPHSFADLSQGKIAHIDFDISVDFSQRSLSLKATYRLEKPVSGSLYLDTRDLSIERVHANGKDIAWEMDAQDPIIGDRLHLKELEALSEFTIEVTTSPQSTALQWVTPQQTAGGDHPFLYSQCQAIHARSIFPCQDTPSVRLTYQARMKVPKPLVAVMGAASTGIEDQETTRTYAFKMDQPIPSYLFALAAGNIAFKELGPRTGIYAEQELIDAAAWEFAENEEKLEQGEKLFGPYLWERYDAIVMPPSFPYGGMENPRLTFMSTIYLMGDRSWTAIISHELAHAWTGNLVTNTTWEHFWLNEGWTTYAEMRITEAVEGKEVASLETVIYAKALWETLERFGMEANITCLKPSMEGIDPDEVFSNIPYYKGFLLIRQLELAVGRKRFDAFIRKYIETYHFKSIDTEGFVQFLKNELPEAVEKVDVNSWIYEPGLPEGAMDLHSSLHSEALAVAEGYLQGKPLTKEQIEGWHSDQVLSFLFALPQQIPAEDCASIDEVFDFKHKWNNTLQARFLALCIHSGYSDIMPRVEHFVETYGRGISLSRIFRAIIAEDWTKRHVRPLFERIRERHHPVAIATIEKLITKAGL